MHADLAFVRDARAWLERLWTANDVTHCYDTEAFGKVLGGRWAATCIHAAAAGDADAVWKLFWESELARFVDRTLEKNRGIPQRGN